MSLRAHRTELRVGLLACALLSAACAGQRAASTAPPTAPAREARPAAPPPRDQARTPRPEPNRPAPGSILAKDSQYVILIAGPGDTSQSLAARFLGGESRAWVIEDFNEPRGVVPGQEVVIPLVEENPLGVYADGYQTVPILCYHRFGDKKAKMVVTPAAFAEQMEYLARSGYRVLRLTDLIGFFEGRSGLPKKSVVVTIDDGYRSSYQVAYPVFKRLGFPATIFVYTDFIGANDGLTWGQLAEMAESGLIDLQPHSKSHSDLGIKTAQETPQAYARRVKEELTVPQKILGERLQKPMETFAYPYGDANDLVVAQTREAGYRLAATVQPGGNGFFAHPYLLRRTMIFGEDDLEAFKAKLESRKALRQP